MVTPALHALSTIMAFGWLAACNPIVVDAFDPPDAQVPPVAIDRCPDDATKIEPGVCGCGVPDHDFDEDGAFDCSESCPDNAARVEPMGACGCSDSTDIAACDALRGALRHLYTFNERGLTVTDAVSGADGRIAHTLPDTPVEDLEALQLNGRLHFDGIGSHVELPAGIMSALTDATFEVWLTWRGNQYWSRIFDFGDSSGNTGQTYLFLTPSNAENGALRVAYSLASNPAETIVDGPAALLALPSRGQLQHVAVVVDEVGQEMRLYTDGVEVAFEPFADTLTAVSDENNWLGRSNYSGDPLFTGSFIEFRIYEQALDSEQIRASFEAGPGALDD